VQALSVASEQVQLLCLLAAYRHWPAVPVRVARRVRQLGPGHARRRAMLIPRCCRSRISCSVSNRCTVLMPSGRVVPRLVSAAIGGLPGPDGSPDAALYLGLRSGLRAASGVVSRVLSGTHFGPELAHYTYSAIGLIVVDVIRSLGLDDSDRTYTCSVCGQPCSPHRRLPDERIPRLPNCRVQTCPPAEEPGPSLRESRGAGSLIRLSATRSRRPW